MKPQKNKLILAFIYLVVIQIGCGIFYSKEKYIKDFKSFIIETKENCSEYEKSDWKISDEQYNKFTVELYEKFKDDLSEDEKREIYKLKGAYSTLKMKSNIKEIIDQASGFIEGAVETITN